MKVMSGKLHDILRKLPCDNGTTQNCMACNKTVYPVDRVAPDNSRVFHRSCFRCHHCNNTLKIASFNSFEGILYCGPHFDQLLKKTGSLDKSFEGAPKIEKPADNKNANSNEVSSYFEPTREKCVVCSKTVYLTERISIDKTMYRGGCFKCTHGGCTISPSNYIAHEGKPYCKHHHVQLFKEKGNYGQLLETDSDREPQPSMDIPPKSS